MFSPSSQLLNNYSITFHQSLPGTLGNTLGCTCTASAVNWHPNAFEMGHRASDPRAGCLKRQSLDRLEATPARGSRSLQGVCHYN